MSTKMTQGLLICMVVLSVIATPVTASPSFGGDQPVSRLTAYDSSNLLSLTQQVDEQPDERLLQIAATTGREADQLLLLSDESLTLLNGKTLQRYKALDLVTGEIVGASFDGVNAVDEDVEREAAGKEWRAEYGAMTPQLLQQLAELAPDEQLDISVWLQVDIQPLPRPSEASVSSDAVPETAVTPTEMIGGAPQLNQAEKDPARPIPHNQMPPDVRSRLRDTTVDGQVVIPEGSKPADTSRPDSVPDRTDEMERMEAFEQQNNAAIKTQIAPVRAHFLELMQARGIEVAYASEIVPSAVINGVTREQIESLAFLPEIDAIYAVPKYAGPLLSTARPTQNMTLVNTLGYNGSGVKVSVTEGERGFAANPYLAWTDFYDDTQPYADHPTAVGGIIKSTAPGFLGLANGVQLYSANGSYGTWATMAAAMDWGTTTATVLNNSWYWDNPNSAVFWEADRRQDYYMRYNYDFVAVAAGNFGNGCGGNFTTYVASPAKGYNVMSVGNYEDNNSLVWSDDAMDICSSFGNPGADSASPSHEKPEVSAVGATIKSTLVSTSTDVAQAIGNVGSGTSYASPMVSALAAAIIQANPGFANQPERIKSIIMATALHNIEGDSRLSDVDGTGGMVGTAALATVERDHSADLGINDTTAFPIYYSQFAYKGERVRFVINWQSNPNASYTTDALPVDLDLTAFRADGTTFLASSVSSNNSFEIVDFIAPASETYQFRISKFGSYTGSNSWLGLAWWRGTYRISPDTGYSDPKATPLGTHLSVYPTDWSPTNYWRAFGIRSTGSDHDLELYSRSHFDDPGQRAYLEGSYVPGENVDFIVVDGNHWPAADQEQYWVYNFSGDGGYRISWSNQGTTLAPGLYGPFTMGSSEVVNVFDVRFWVNQPLKISVIPGGGNAADLGVSLFRSNPSSSSTYHQNRLEATRTGDASTSPGATESLTYSNQGNPADYLGLVVYSKTTNSANYYILVEDLRVYLPLLIR